MAEKNLTISGIAYKVKDWLVIFAAIGGVAMYGTKVWSSPERLDTVEKKVVLLNENMIEIRGDLKYLIKTVDEIRKQK